jgi:hypothetical protein
MVAIIDRDKKMIICKFMEELCDKHQSARENNLPTDFFFLKDFYNIGLFNKYLLNIGLRASPGEIRKLVLDTLRKYAEEEGFVKIDENIVTLTEKGLLECQRSFRDWD